MRSFPGVHVDPLQAAAKSNGIAHTGLSWQPSSLAHCCACLLQIWDHGGFAPEVDKRLSAKDHIGLLDAWLKTAPVGQRYVDVSWNT
jgi:hypothetical protein